MSNTEQPTEADVTKLAARLRKIGASMTATVRGHVVTRWGYNVFEVDSHTGRSERTCTAENAARRIAVDA